MSSPQEPPAGDVPGPVEPGAPSYPPYGESLPSYPQPAYGQQPYAQPPYGQPVPGGYPVGLRNGLGTAALVLGIVGTVLGALLFLFFVVFVLGLLAVIFGLIGRGRAKRGEASNSTAATWGFALGVVSLVLSAVGLLFVIHVIQDRQDCRERATTAQQYNDCNHKF